MRPVSRTTFLVLVTAVLFTVLLVVFVGVFDSTRERLRDEDRRRAVTDLVLAADRIGGLVELARDKASEIANQDAVAKLFARDDALGRARELSRLDLGAVAGRCSAVELSRDGRVLASWRARGALPLEGPSDAFAPEATFPLLETARAVKPGHLLAVLSTTEDRAAEGGSASEARLRVLMPLGKGAVVSVEVDASDAVEKVRAAVRGGGAALVDATGAAVGQPLDDPDARALAASDDTALAQGQVDGDRVLAVTPCRRDRWRSAHARSPEHLLWIYPQSAPDRHRPAVVRNGARSGIGASRGLENAAARFRRLGETSRGAPPGAISGWWRSPSRSPGSKTKQPCSSRGYGGTFTAPCSLIPCAAP